MIQNLGLQLYTIRDHMKDADDIRASFARLRELGYTEAQTAGSGGVSYMELAALAKEAGIKIVGTHYSLDTMINDFEQTVNDHEAMGTTNCGIGGFFAKSESEVREFIEKVNKVADKLYERGMKFTYHNHSQEFIKINETTTIMDLLVSELNPEKTSFVLDTCWVQFGGGDVRYWIEKLQGRIDILHLKDFSRKLNASCDMMDRGSLMLEEVGSGNLYWDGIIESAEKTGIKHFCVEQDFDWINGDPFASLKSSADYLKKYMA